MKIYIPTHSHLEIASERLAAPVASMKRLAMAMWRVRFASVLWIGVGVIS